jgi:hypothetical protein
MKIIFIICPYAAASLLLLACNSSLPAPSNPLFQGTEIISVYSPTNGQQVSTNYPDFSWQATGLSYEVAGVFDNPILVSGKQIQNSNDCIAIWNTGMTGIDGNVNYSLFKEVSGGIITSSYAAPLTNGTYYWAVWAYDSGLSISNSSEEIKFTY